MDEQGRTVLRRFLTGLLVVVVIFSLAWLIFLRDSGEKADGNQANGTNAAQNAAKENRSRPSANTKSTAGAAAGSSQVGGAQTASGQNSSGTGQLAATGTGNPVTIFLGTAVVAALGHYLYTRRKWSRS